MSFNGSGSFLINTAGQPVVSGTVISSTAFNALTADLATGLSTCITKDGQTTVTANIPMANYKFTGLGVGSGAADSANLSQVQSTVVKLLASVSGTDTITAVGSPTVAAYAAGQMFYFVAAGDNTGAVTINIDSLGAKAVTRDGSVALAAGDIKSGEVVVVVYDGTRFQVVSQLNSSGDARFANVSIASALNVGGVATVTGGSVLNGGVVINEPGADVDFRVEGDTDANLIFADASTDRVGFGTNTPGAKTEIYVNRTSSTNAVAINLNDNVTGAQTDGVYKAIRSLSNNGASISEIRFMETDGSNNNTSIAFATQASANALTERMRINQAGNLGLGVTPSAWNPASQRVIQLGAGAATGAVVSDNGGNYGQAQNAFIDTGGWKYYANGTASLFSQSGTGGFNWFNAPSGTAGNTITFTQAMTLNASGSLALLATSGNGCELDLSANGTSANKATFGFGFATASDNIAFLYNRTNNALVFGTNNTERARITAAGSLFVNTTSGIYTGAGCVNAVVASSADFVFSGRNTNGTNPRGLYLQHSNTTAGDYAIYFEASAATKFYVDGNGVIYSTNTSVQSISDARHKENVRPLAEGLNEVLALKPRRFDWKEGKGANTKDVAGFIAQEVEEVLPELISEWKETVDAQNSYKAIAMGNMIPMMVKAIQEQQAMIKSLEAKVAALESK
jgi:hypothetical protein